MYSNRTVFDRRPKPTKTPIFRPQQIRENCFQLCETPQNGAIEGFGKCFMGRGRVGEG